MPLKLNPSQLIQDRKFLENFWLFLRLGIIATVIFIGGQLTGCQSRVHERDFQNQSGGRDIKSEIKASGQASMRLEDAKKFLLRIKDIAERLKDFVPVAIDTGRLDDMSLAIEQSSRSLYTFENGSILFSGELDSQNQSQSQSQSQNQNETQTQNEIQNLNGGQTGSPNCPQHRFSIKYSVPEDKLEIVILHCDSLVQKTVLSSVAAEGKIRIADESVSEKEGSSKLAFACESTAARKMSCQNIVLGPGVDSRWFLGFSREGGTTQVKVEEIEVASTAIRTSLEFKIDSDGKVIQRESEKIVPQGDSAETLTQPPSEKVVVEAEPEKVVTKNDSTDEGPKGQQP